MSELHTLAFVFLESASKDGFGVVTQLGSVVPVSLPLRAMSNYMTELFYGKPEPVWVINNRRRMGVAGDAYYPPGMTSRGYVGPEYAADNARGTSLLPEVTVKTHIYGMSDTARIKHVLAAEGVFNVVCDIPQQIVKVQSNLSPRMLVGLIRQVTGSAHVINYVDPLQPTFETTQDRVRYAYDDSYSYDGRTGYAPAYSAPYNGRSYDNEFRPGGYARYGGNYY